jgi:uncharacterized protein (TIGR02246 family)
MFESRIDTDAVLTGAAAQFGVQPWYDAVPVPVAGSLPHEFHWTLPTDSVPSPVSSSVFGRSLPWLTTPWNRTGSAVVAVGWVVAVVVEVAGTDVVEEDVAGTTVVTVVVELLPQAASASAARRESESRRVMPAFSPMRPDVRAFPIGQTPDAPHAGLEQSPSTSFTPQEASMNPTSEITHLLAGLAAPWNAGDIAGVTALFTADGRLVSPYGHDARGAAAVRDLYQAFLGDGPLRGSHTTVDVQDVRAFGPDVAVADCRQVIETREMGTLDLHLVVVVIHGDRGWRIAECRPYAFMPDPVAVA